MQPSRQQLRHNLGSELLVAHLTTAAHICWVLAFVLQFCTAACMCCVNCALKCCTSDASCSHLEFLCASMHACWAFSHQTSAHIACAVSMDTVCSCPSASWVLVGTSVLTLAMVRQSQQQSDGSWFVLWHLALQCGRYSSRSCFSRVEQDAWPS
jgi:hypothetical protein